MKFRIIIIVCLAAVAVSVFSCGDEEDKSIFRPDDGIDWPDMTEVEDCVTLFEMAYEHRNIEKYGQALLRPDTSSVFPDGYYWYNQEEDFNGGSIPKLTFSREEDIAVTDSLFSHVLGMELDLLPGEWDTLEVFRGEACSGCWQTYRSYYFDLQLDDSRHMLGDFYLRFVAGPDPENPGRYLLYQVEDRMYITRKRKGQVPLSSEVESLGEIKSIYYQPPPE